MYVKNIKLRNFRNYSYLNLDLVSGMNILLGNNGEGKTNLLEAIYLLSTTRSHRNDDNKEMIAFNQQFAAVEGTVVSSQSEDKLGIVVQKTGKTLLLNNHPVKKNSEFIGKANAVLFSPSDMNLFTDSPKIRRRLIDVELGKLSNAYMYNLSNYLKCLKERNAFLKTSSNNLLLETYTELLIDPQIRIIKERAKFIKFLNAYITYFYNQLSGGQEKVQIVYRSFINEREDEEVMRNQLKEAYDNSKDKDIFTRQTNLGIHREDYDFYLNGLNVAKYSSQGQKRMVLLALKLSIVQIIYQLKREYPVLLLDDVFSELDANHRVCLLKLLPNSVQTIITTTDIREINLIRSQNVNVLHVEKGAIE
ncbi:MAG: DNA replication/repair protein RecF [Erysipelotrichaceae bacterium]|nr:DNA replication/repair protein RecF [Erysipelotrichaceae bacterium]